MQAIVSVSGLSKVYATGFRALNGVTLDVRRGEIFALLGPNGAGKTTLINVICGVATATAGRVLVGGHDIVGEYRAARSMIGLVPQELTTDAFETVWATVSFSRGLFGHRRNPALVERVLRDLSLWDKRDSTIMTLSGGMKRRVLVAKALAHEPEILFLDEPTAGVDVELRQDMWQLVRRLRDSGVTIILTTHYLEEAEQLAERIGVINKGEMILVEEKAAIMRKFGNRRVIVTLQTPAGRLPESLAAYALELSPDGGQVTYTCDTSQRDTGIRPLLQALDAAGLPFADLQTKESSLEEIFVGLLRDKP
ncbi:MAG TPA: ABC transporter ATP-binding protein [Acetobacteraceae bacterium]|nr:ABC transporter ATP-binding protein [Acetobacteraceae bacterium]